ncbi:MULTISPECIES: roadblock/LC7 domain-containing protein [Pseudonocardiaceae]|uniref:Dynein regulation protein LC7 n=3 Tax=Kibdelosporangium TaxID=2029 RepID=A0A1W2FQ16_KIBAR|nr:MULTISPECIES: roadblock/LC7 domain-containing protein [Pseudonocardiaceae]ALG07262.1 dynein regulation protein LC7 [Kibdelosporangium phytohabitans]MBE1471878.1 putative regulator of Ras-like GTPase activity (Roadblock/LC7/MglB family) [Kibdelosporangium phytohabitans]NRN65932.1 Dynein regulation protein LC7 [Kibdelosporangium persicum]ONI80996.1 dynein regulation protein LC7 [Actinosynnema sp. ALI-1.44]RSM89403.1 dynein regulation protein LC7 [Kibdelosporangium aridum]
MITPPGVSTEAQNFNWLVSRFAQGTAGAIAAIAVSADGLLIAMSSDLARQNADRLAAIASAMLGLANGVSDTHPLGQPDKIIIELERGYLLVCTISIGCSLGVLATKQASLGTIAYEMAMFANRASAVLTPQLIEELKNSVGQ